MGRWKPPPPASSPYITRAGYEQLQQELKTWDQKFERPQDYIVPPAEEAQATLQQIELELRRLEGTRKVLTDYAESLRARLEKHGPAAKP